MAKAQQLQQAKSNVPDAIVQKYIREISGAREALESANGSYRAVLKAAKGEGINQKQLLAALADSRRDPAQIAVDDRDFARYRALLNMPVHQPDLFASDSTAAEETPTLIAGEPTDHQLWEATEAGKKAGANGGDISAVPYENAQMAASWTKGFKAGMKIIAERMGSGAKVASTRKKRDGGAQQQLDS